MKFDNDVFDYLSGSQFSNGAPIKISKKNEPIYNRFQIIESLCANKNIIHLGCVDHLPLISKKIEQNIWLHARLCKVAKMCLGIDINVEGINYLKNKLGYKDVIYGDIANEDIGEIRNNYWNFLVMGEILEHVDNPVLFLQQIHEKYENNIEKLIITVPNAFSWQNFINVFYHRELINTDHRYWFSPYTLAKILFQSGMQVEEFYFCNSININNKTKFIISHPKILFHNFLYKIYPATRLTLLMIAKL
jgi:hypothetical protein